LAGAVASTTGDLLTPQRLSLLSVAAPLRVPEGYNCPRRLKPHCNSQSQTFAPVLAARPEPATLNLRLGAAR